MRRSAHRHSARELHLRNPARRITVLLGNNDRDVQDRQRRLPGFPRERRGVLGDTFRDTQQHRERVRRLRVSGHHRLNRLEYRRRQSILRRERERILSDGHATGSCKPVARCPSLGKIVIQGIEPAGGDLRRWPGEQRQIVDQPRDVFLDLADSRLSRDGC